MSYILDALKKSEQERELGRVPTFTTVHHVHPNKVKKDWRWLAGSALVLNLVVGAVVYWYVSEKTSPSVKSEPLAAARPPAIVENPPVPLISEPPAESVFNSAEPPTLTWPDGEELPPQTLDELNDPASMESAADALLAQESAAEEINSDAQIAEPPQQQPDAVALLSEMDQQFRASVPPLSIDVHVFSGKSAERFVFVNMVKYREGQTINGKVLLREITPEGVVLNYKSQDFRLARP